MDGDFKGDFTRDTFYGLNRFSRVLMQQGRVQLDADWNEQVDILLYHLRSLTRDLIGSYAARNHGFLISQAQRPGKTTKGTRSKTDTQPLPDIVVSAGHYYVNGILCESDGSVTFTFSDDQRKNNPIYIVYLDVWERQVTYIENKYIREVALGALGPDTATRAKVEWQIKVTNSMPKPDGTAGSTQIPNPLPDDLGQQPATFIKDLDTSWDKCWVPILQSQNRGQLKARASEVSKQDTTPCIISPESRFRGAENQLYRVEIHKGSSPEGGGATFKWSRENGSVVFPISNLAGKAVTLDTLGRDKRFGLKPDDWVEIVDDDYYLQGSPNSLVQIATVDITNMLVILKDMPGSSIGQSQAKHPFLRRWDQNGREELDQESVTVDKDGIAIVESTDDTNWFTLEDNIQIQFQASNASDSSKTPPQYRTGDFWLIPARTATGNIEWPYDESGLPIVQKPHGVEHHYAPLALVSFSSDKISQKCDLRRKLANLWNSPGECPETQ